jgi:hypothetical protein
MTRLLIAAGIIVAVSTAITVVLVHEGSAEGPTIVAETGCEDHPLLHRWDGYHLDEGGQSLRIAWMGSSSHRPCGIDATASELALYTTDPEVVNLDAGFQCIEVRLPEAIPAAGVLRDAADGDLHRSDALEFERAWPRPLIRAVEERFQNGDDCLALNP